MSVLALARLQFAVTVAFHFLFPPITIGLALLLVLVETARLKTGKSLYARMSDFWITIFSATFVMGVASGIVMEFEFGTNWAGYSRFVGDIFGAPLAAEGIFAFFLESGFLGLLVFGRKRIGSFLRWFSALMVCVGTLISAFWILVANSWMQTPAGFRVEGGRAYLTSFSEAVFNPSLWPRFAHSVASAWACGAYVMLGVSAWLWRRARARDVALAGMKLATVVAFAATALVFLSGDRHARQVARTQQAKFAAMEGVYSTTAGAPLVIFSLPPRQSGPRPGPEIVVTQLTSKLAFGDFQAPVRGLSDFPRSDWPPVAITFLAFHNMVVVGNLMALELLFGIYLVARGRLARARRWQTLMIWSVPLPMIAIQLGWATAEVGRQPWIVYDVLRTASAVSPVVRAAQVASSLVLFLIVYALIFACWAVVVGREIAHGPAEAPAVQAAEARP